MAMIGQRAGFKPIKPRSDEMMGIRNLQATSMDDSYYPEQYYATQAGISGLGDAYSDRAAHFAYGVAADAHSGMGATDEQFNARYQELAQHEAYLKDKILKLEAEIAWQEKLRDNEMSGDPMWEVAKHKFIYDNDASSLEGIMSRKAQAAQLKASQDIQKEQLKASKESELASKDAAARRGRDYLTWTFNNYKTNPDDLQALDNLFAAKQKLEELAQDAGKQPEDYYNDTTLEEINVVLNEGLKKKQEKVETAKKNAAAAKAKTAEDNELKNILADYNKSTHTRVDRRAKKDELEKTYPNYTFTVVKGKITATRKAGK